MNVTPLGEPLMIADDAALLRIAQKLAQEPLLAIDTESNNMYAYQPRICLFQVSTRKADYIIDPLNINDMQPFGDLLYDERIEKVFHGAEYDLAGIKRDYDFDLRNLFDTLLAARLLGRDALALNDIVQAYFGVEMDKSHQLDNWGKRPLSRDSLRYAQMDTHYLPPLRDALHAELAASGDLPQALEVFEDYTRVRLKNTDFDPEGYWKIGKSRKLSRRQLGVLRELYLLRDELARRDDLPAHKIISNRTLVEMASRPPRNNYDLAYHIQSKDIRLFGEQILAAVHQGYTQQPPHPPRRKSSQDRALTSRYNMLHNWRKERARERDVEANIVASKALLWELAEELPQDADELAQIRGLGVWRIAQYGDSLLDVLRHLRRRKDT
jgi:ribonuclease D